MELFDDVMGQVRGLGTLPKTVLENPKVVWAAATLLSTKDPAVGGSAGLGGLIKAFQDKGLGDIMVSWVGKGPNKKISPMQINDVLGKDTMRQFAQMAGLNPADAGMVLSEVLPVLVNKVTPDGKVPEVDRLEKVLDPLLADMAVPAK